MQESSDEQIMRDFEIMILEIDDPDYTTNAQQIREALQNGIEWTKWEDAVLATRTEKQKQYINRELWLSYDRRKDEGFDSCQRFWNLEFLDEAQSGKLPVHFHEFIEIWSFLDENLIAYIPGILDYLNEK